MELPTGTKSSLRGLLRSGAIDERARSAFFAQLKICSGGQTMVWPPKRH